MLFDPEIWFFQTTGISMFQVETGILILGFLCALLATFRISFKGRIDPLALAVALWLLVLIIRSL